MINIDIENKRIIYSNNKIRNTVTINENDIMQPRFLEGTYDTYKCILVFKEVDKYNESGKVIGKEIKPFAQRKGNPNWLLSIKEDEFIF